MPSPLSLVSTQTPITSRPSASTPIPLPQLRSTARGRAINSPVEAFPSYTTASATNAPFLAALFMAISAMLFGSMSILVKAIAPTIPALESVCVRGAIGTVVLAAIMRRRNIPIFGRHKGALALRGIIGTLASFCCFLAVAHAPIAEAAAIYRSAGLLTPILALVILRERFHPERLCYALVGFVGAIAILRPGFHEIPSGLIFAIAAAFFNSFAMVTVRSLSAKEHPATIIFYFSLFSSVTAAVMASHSFIAPNLHETLLLGAIAITGLSGQYFFTLSIARAETSFLTPIGYLEVVTVAILSWMLFGSLPDMFGWSGIALIVAAGVAVSRTTRSS